MREGGYNYLPPTHSRIVVWAFVVIGGRLKFWLGLVVTRDEGHNIRGHRGPGKGVSGRLEMNRRYITSQHGLHVSAPEMACSE